MTPLESTFAVVVNWNGGPQNLLCLDSLIAGGLAARRIVFVDNASRDGSAQAVAERYGELIQIANPRNLGFGVAANQGAREALDAGATAVLFVNNDVTFPPRTLEAMAAVLEANPRVGLLGPRVLFPGDPPRVWAAGGVMDFGPNLSTLIGHGRPDGPQFRATRSVDYVPGCALLARRALLEEVGLFEEGYFAYMEDVELGLRARRAGWWVLCLGEVACYHQPSSSTGGGYSARRKYLNALNSVRFLRAHGRPWQWAAFVLCDVAALPLALVAGLLPGRGGGRGRAVLAKALGLAHGLMGRPVRAELLEPGATPLW